MESKQIVAIGLLSALLGGIVGGGITFYLVNPQITEISNALTQNTDVLSENSNTIIEIANSLKGIANEIDIQKDQLDEMGSQISTLRTEIEDIQEITTELVLKPSFHIAYNELLWEPSEFDSKSGEFDIKGNNWKIDYDISIYNMGADEYYYTWVQIIIFNDEGLAQKFMYLEGNEHNRNQEQFYGTFSVNLPPGTYYLDIFANKMNIINHFYFTVWDYY